MAGGLRDHRSGRIDPRHGRSLSIGVEPEDWPTKIPIVVNPRISPARA